jgi:hypothetical protein
MRPIMTLLIALVVAQASCGPAPRLDPAAPADRPAETTGGEMAPTPYTADQIRDASRTGRTYVYRVEAEGEPVRIREMRFFTVDAAGAEIVTTVFDEQGTEIHSEPPSRSSWEELRRHALFPRDAVEISDEEITVPAGTFACMLYTLTDRAEGSVTKFYFARELPGAPVLFFTDANGHRVMTTTLVSHDPGAG